MNKVLIGTIALIIASVTSKADSDAPSEQDRPSTIFAKLSQGGFSLTRTFSGPDSISAAPDKSEPAEFGFVDDIDKDTEFHANFFLHYASNARELGQWTITPAASIEGKISSADTASSDAWRFRASAEFDIPFGPRAAITDPLDPQFSVSSSANALFASLGVKYETDRDFIADKISAELVLSPTIPSCDMGRYGPVGSKLSDGKGAVDIRWRPLLEVDFGRTDASGAVSRENGDTLLRLRPRIRVEFRLNFLSRAVGIKHATAYVDYEYVNLPLEGGDISHSYVVAGIDFALSDNLGLAFTYSYGEQAPNFLRENRFSGALTVGF